MEKQFKVKIIGCSSGMYWYDKHVGEEFDVVPFATLGDFKDADSVVKDGEVTPYLIQSPDYEVIPEGLT